MYEDLTQLIGTLGFPVAMCVYLVIYQNKALRAQTAMIERLDKTLIELEVLIKERLR